MPLSHIVHDRAGSGEPVVLIHGIGHRRQAWKPVFDRLAERYDVIALDLSGFGESDPYPQGQRYDMDNACLNLAGHFADWGVERPHVVGNSLGGAISLELAARDLVSSATVLSPAGFFGPVDRIYALGLLVGLRAAASVPDRLLRRIVRSERARKVIGFLLYARPELHDAEATYADSLGLRNASAFFPTVRAGVGYELSMPTTSVPVTVAWGTLDRILPYRQAAKARQTLPDAHHVPLPGCGHVPMSDNPELIVQLIDETIERTQQQGAA